MIDVPAEDPNYKIDSENPTKMIFGNGSSGKETGYFSLFLFHSETFNFFFI